jgi:hypothetical protein
MERQRQAMQQRISNISSTRAYPLTERRVAIKGRGFFVGSTMNWHTSSRFPFGKSHDAIVAFAGADIAVAKYYPEDEKYLLEFEPSVAHYELFQ